MAFCIKCGNELPDDAVFCNKCGQKMLVAEEASAHSRESNETQAETAQQESIEEIRIESTTEPSQPASDTTTAEDEKNKKKEPNRALVSFFMPYLGVYYFFKYRKDDAKKAKSCLIAAIISCAVLFLAGALIWSMEEMILRLFYIFFVLPMGLLIGCFMLAEKPSNEYSTASSLKSNGEIFDGFIREYDEMTGSCKYRHPKARGRMGTVYGTNGNLWPYFVSNTNSGKYSIRLQYCFTYGGHSSIAKWLFIEKIIFKTDTNRYFISVSPNREHQTSNGYSTFWESGVITIITPEDFVFFKDIATSKTLRVRLNGSSKYLDLNFDSVQARRIIIDAYNACINSPEYLISPIPVEQKTED